MSCPLYSKPLNPHTVYICKINVLKFTAILCWKNQSLSGYVKVNAQKSGLFHFSKTFSTYPPPSPPNHKECCAWNYSSTFCWETGTRNGHSQMSQDKRGYQSCKWSAVFSRLTTRTHSQVLFKIPFWRNRRKRVK